MPTKDFKMPEKVLIEELSNHHGIFALSPVEPGFGHTIGNSLRRVLLASLEGYAIVGIKFGQSADVLHEFASIQGVVEDVTEIILNLKQVRFKKTGILNQEKLFITHQNKKTFTAGDLAKATSTFEILNPDHIICHTDVSANFELELNIQKGRGYVPVEENKTSTQIIGYIPIDAIFSPIENVKYKVENTLVEQKTDYEKVIIEIKTDGSITPTQAIQRGARNLIDHFSLLIDKEIVPEEDYEPEKVLDEENLRIQKDLNTPLRELNLSPRALNCFKSHEVKTLKDIVKLIPSQLMKYRNFGKKSMAEVKELVERKKLSFGMNVSAYQIDDTNY